MSLYDFVAFNLRWRRAWLLLVPIVLAGLLALMLGAGGSGLEWDPYSSNLIVFVGWGVAAVLAVVSIVAIWSFFDTREQLRIGTTGIKTVPWSDRTIPWAEIEEVSAGGSKWRPQMILQIRNPDRFPPRKRARLFARFRRKPSEGCIPIRVAGIDCTLDEAMAAVERFRRLKK